eukprot:NODE_374_length_8570_cov_0.578208.p8 type:complete len:102 gc:universal NODE_374_length_8570_cov_0.578208:3447-3752(+)
MYCCKLITILFLVIKRPRDLFFYMSQIPLHSQDLLFRFNVNGDLVVNYSQETESRQECDTVNPFDLQSWLQKCASIRCCTARCINHAHLFIELFTNYSVKW